MKICCMADPGEAQLSASLGADLVGLVGPMPSGAGIIAPERCREIAEAAPAWVTPVLLTSSETAEAIAEDVRAAGVRAVQIVQHVAAAVHGALARLLPGVRRLQVVHVERAAALEIARGYAGHADALLLDSGRPAARELGGTGRVHDWALSAAIVREAGVPVFLAGGLGPGNVGRAIAEVRPFGVDVCSGVRTDGRLDATKLAAFMAAVRNMGAA